MESRLFPGLVYEASSEVAPHDMDFEAETWTYEDREVWRGDRDPRYEHDVYWLYDEGVQRVGLVEYAPGGRHAVLWIYDNPFATFFQEPGWSTTGDTLWTEMPSHAYEYCLEHGITTVQKVQALASQSEWTILTLEDVLQGKPVRDVFRVFCVDADCVIYRPPVESRIWSRLRGGDATEAPQPRSPPESAPVA